MDRHARQWPCVLAALCLVGLIPQCVGTTYWLNILNLCCVMSIACLGLNILLGYTGQINLAQAAFLGVGAYTSALLTVNLGIPVWLGIVCGGLMGGVFGILLGIPSLKLAGHYLAVTTIGFGFIVQLVLINWIDLTHGSDGITQIPPLNILGYVFDSEKRYFYFSGSMVVLFVWFSMRLKQSRMGRAMLAVRQNEMAAGTCGINITLYKIIAFTLSSACAGVAGGMFAHGGAHYISPDTFSFEQSVLMLAMAVLGGDGSPLGAVLGATLLTLLPESLRFLQDAYMLFFSAAIICIMIYMPGGIVNLVAQWPPLARWRRRARAATDDAAPEESAALPPLPCMRKLAAKAEGAEDDVLEITGLAKHFGGLKAVDGVDMTIRRGVVHSLIGPNGSGKTTTINMLSGLYKPTSGHIRLCGEDITDKPAHEIARRGISRTYQNIRLFADMTALENVLVGEHAEGHAKLLGCIAHGPGQRSEERTLRERALQVLHFVGLKGLEHERAGSLPYGRQRLLEIARALAASPVLLLLDEPAAGLNPTETEELRVLLRRIKDMGITILLVEHDMELVMTVSDCITVLNFGRKIAEGDAQRVRSHPEVITAYLGQEADDAAS